MTAKQTPPPAVRNAPFLIEVLRPVLPLTGTILEIASGSGYHAAAFAAAFPHLTWQPSDANEQARASIAAYAAENAQANLSSPLDLDVMAATWPMEHASGVVCINMIHISPWAATLALFAGAARLLSHDAPLFTYGPYILHGDFIADSNVAFDQSLKERNPQWGLRDVEDISRVAHEAGFRMENIVPMPANNFSLIFRKGAR